VCNGKRLGKQCAFVSEAVDIWRNHIPNNLLICFIFFDNDYDMLWARNLGDNLSLLRKGIVLSRRYPHQENGTLNNKERGLSKQH